jgi:peptidoglycan hydrolase-like protein with peptidoglycan-binding domain
MRATMSSLIAVVIAVCTNIAFGQPQDATALKRSEDAKKWQRALKARGHDLGPIDGAVGPKTREAVKAFQASQGLEASGEFNEKTAQLLGGDLRVFVFEGLSDNGSLQEALNDAVQKALKSSKATTDPMISYVVTRISGSRGGIDASNRVAVTIEISTP